MKIGNNILKHYLKNVYFITGTAYAGKSTTVKMLADRYDMIFCGENYHSKISDTIATQETHPNISYINNLTDWKDFVTRTPEEYDNKIIDSLRQFSAALLCVDSPDGGTKRSAFTHDHNLFLGTCDRCIDQRPYKHDRMGTLEVDDDGFEF